MFGFLSSSPILLVKFNCQSRKKRTSQSLESGNPPPSLFLRNVQTKAEKFLKSFEIRYRNQVPRGTKGYQGVPRGTEMVAKGTKGYLEGTRGNRGVPRGIKRYQEVRRGTKRCSEVPRSTGRYLGYQKVPSVPKGT